MTHKNEKIYNKNQLNERPSVREMLMPTNLPEAGFQSYEMLKNDATEQKAAFIAGEVINPTLNYPLLKDVSAMDAGIIRLYETIETVRSVEMDDEKADIIASSLEYRAAEMEYIKLLARIDFVVNEHYDTETVTILIEEARELGENLYGVPDETVRDSAYAEIWKKIDNKNLSPSAKKVYDELQNGFTWGDRTVAGLPRPEGAENLPNFNDPSLAWAGEVVLEKNANIVALISDFWDAKVKEHGEEYTASPTDVCEAFEQVLLLLDPNQETGVRILMDPDSTAMSWDSSVMAAKIGAKREPIETKNSLLQKTFHELVKHGGSAINGLKSELPVLGTGLYTNTKRSGYLPFEEGYSITIEEAISDEDPAWSDVSIGRYVATTLAYNRADFRDVFETSWRYTALSSLKDGQELTDEIITKYKDAAYKMCVRVFRGTPTNLSEKYPYVDPLTYNKDLAYLSGRIIAMKHIKKLYETKDEKELMRPFGAKFDPTIPEQDAIERKYISEAA